MNEFEKETNKTKPPLHLFHIEKETVKENTVHTGPIYIYEPKGHKIAWAFRVLFNNLLFCTIVASSFMVMDQSKDNSYKRQPIQPVKQAADNNYGFETKKVLIKNGLDIKADNYKFVRETIKNPQWMSFWKEHFNSKGETAIFKSILEDSLKNKKDILNDIETIKKIGDL